MEGKSLSEVTVEHLLEAYKTINFHDHTWTDQKRVFWIIGKIKNNTLSKGPKEYLKKLGYDLTPVRIFTNIPPLSSLNKTDIQ
jgi:ATP-dependent phosphoenolpyruvate carboxykinase